MFLKSLAYHKELEKISEEDLPFYKLKNKNILVTGATGLIGSYMVDVLLKINEIHNLTAFVTVICRDEEKAKARFKNHINKVGFQIVQGDICEPLSVESEWDYVIHCAGKNHPAVFAAEPVETMLTSLIGTINILEYCKNQKKRPECILFASSGEIYGDQICQREQGYLENDAGLVQTMNPRSCYPESKRAAETLCASYCYEYGMDIVIARLSYIYGSTFQKTSSKADVQFLGRAAVGKSIILKSEGSQFRSYTYIADAARAIFFILLKGKSGEAYNVANPKSKVTIREFAEKLAEIAGVSIENVNKNSTEEAGYSTMKKEVLDASKLYKLGFEARVGIEEGLRSTLNILKWN